MERRIVWLASYPKSGNTWLRIFLANYLDSTEAPVDVNDLRLGNSSFSRTIFDDALGFDTGDLTPEEFTPLRPVVYRWINNNLREPMYAKTHDACDQLGNGDWLMAPDVTDKVVYLVRNPLDVAVSMANHNQSTIDVAIKNLGAADNVLAKHKPTRLSQQVPQRQGTWSQHVQSWVQNELFTTCVIRYEDMNLSPHKTFAQITKFLGLPSDPHRLQLAIRNSAFDVLSEQECRAGFKERPQKTERFFRKGKVGDWKDVLSESQVTKVISDHQTVMQQFGYVNSNGTPLFTQ